MTGIGSAWRLTLVAISVVIIVALVAFWPTFAVMANTWALIGTYSHGFLVAPISAWLIWRRRSHLAAMRPIPAPSALVLALGAVGSWAIARLLGVQVIEQAAAVAFVVTTIWALVGHRVAYQLMFPLGFLFLMVPVGEALVPPMMDITADSTVHLLEWSGIPVYREGLYFVIPSGNWSVVEACSGVRYLVASFTLGLLYAYLTYRSLWRRLAFVALSLVVPIVANSLRAYMIVMIGHLSDMKLAVGVDHLIYGWVFFGLVMLLLFWLGGLWAEPPQVNDRPDHIARQNDNVPTRVPVTVLVVAIAVAIAASARWLDGASSTSSGNPPSVVLPAHAAGWNLTERPASSWPAHLNHPDQNIYAAYERNGKRVEVLVGLFRSQSQGREAVSTEHHIVAAGRRKEWAAVDHSEMELPIERDSLTVPVTHLTHLGGGLLADSDQRLLVTKWYRLGSFLAAQPLGGKLQQARALLTAGRTDGSVIMLATPDGPDAVARLQAFGEQAMPAIFAALDDAVR